jgi:hypothetical protein
MVKRLILIRSKPEVMTSINVMLDYYDSMMKANNDDKRISREQFFEMFHEYWEWLQGKS